MTDQSADESHETGERGAAARDGIVDQQDAVLQEMADAESADGANDSERRYGESESPA